MDNECFFKWNFNCDNSDLREVGPARIETIIKYSKEYEDGAHTELEAKLKDDSNLKLKCHRNCVSSYTSAEHLKRHKKRSGLGTETAPIPKKSRRSGNLKFQFKEHCIFLWRSLSTRKRQKESYLLEEGSIMENYNKTRAENLQGVNSRHLYKTK